MARRLSYAQRAQYVIQGSSLSLVYFTGILICGIAGRPPYRLYGIDSEVANPYVAIESRAYAANEGGQSSVC